MIPHIILSSDEAPIVIEAVEKDDFDSWLSAQTNPSINWVNAQGFEAKTGAHIVLPNEEGEISRVVLITDGAWDIWSLSKMAASLPKGLYQLVEKLDAETATHAAIGWALASYKFDRYKSSEKKFADLLLPDNADGDEVARLVHAITLARDLINTPAADMGPKALEAAASQVAGEFEARQMNVVGDDLLTYHYPMVHAVGRASDEAPRLIDMVWGDSEHPKITIVGKGVCFDTGGLDLKPSAAMLTMKKDMGGAANALALAYLIMDANLPVRLRVLIPAVENSVSGNAYRPGDVLTSRSGKTVEIGNTDAEGRLVMADAITAADEEEPELLIDMATLTGAARVAVGAEIAATLTDDDELYALIEKSARSVKDPVWRLPLWDDYRSMIDSPIADINNSGNSPFAGATTAGLFLKEFVQKSKSWVHFDIMAFNNRDRPGRPQGGEAMGVRALYKVIKDKYGA